MIFRSKQCHIVGGYYLSLNPGLWSVETYKYLASKLDVSLKENPEIQFGRYQGKYTVGDVISYPPPIQVNNEQQFHSGKAVDGKLFSIVIEDIGADWLTENNLNKPENKDNFVSYPFTYIVPFEIIKEEEMENGKAEVKPCEDCSRKGRKLKETK